MKNSKEKSNEHLTRAQAGAIVTSLLATTWEQLGGKTIRQYVEESDGSV